MLNTGSSSLKDLRNLVTSTVILDNVSAALFSQIKIFSNYFASFQAEHTAKFCNKFHACIGNQYGDGSFGMGQK